MGVAEATPISPDDLETQPMQVAGEWFLAYQAVAGGHRSEGDAGGAGKESNMFFHSCEESPTQVPSLNSKKEDCPF